MYEEHETFIQPEDEDIKVWRYMDFTKLLSLFESRQLYFSRADKFEDPFEGSWPKKNIQEKNLILSNIYTEGSEKHSEILKELSETNKNWSRYMAINCWHLNELESAAMWKLYLKSNEGVAIQSTYSKLKNSITADEKIFLGKIKYINYDTESISAGNILSAFVHKRKSFTHEQEVRAVIAKWPTGKGLTRFTQETIGHGLSIEVDIEWLIEHIYIAPSTPDWFADLVKTSVIRYGYDFKVVHSKLNEDPLF